MEKDYICIACPIGCRLKLTADGGKLVVSGNKCKRGEVYAIEEYSEPKRVVTATCSIGMDKAVSGFKLERMPVKTTKPILKDQIDSLLKDIYALKLKPPVKRGDVLLKDYNGTGIDVVATRSAG
ncbi:MAG TPA: molybdopterin oxidoreductase [Spirochaeta sp.]|nr:molybdopterin oxidoreductase [Spirochaeta sp.]